jgi:hypothetical protein
VLKWRPIVILGLTCAAVAAIAVWVVRRRHFGYWLQVHTGTVNVSGPYYGFWSGFGSDLEEFGILGGIAAAGIYQLVNYHHPDFQGRKPTHELIERLHREHLGRKEAIHGKLREAHDHRTSARAAAQDPPGDVRRGAPRPSAAKSQDLWPTG